ncbi:hypothetical protein DFJ73DRAFT_805743, partial [Zopfochytrium polystomum]
HSPNNDTSLLDASSPSTLNPSQPTASPAMRRSPSKAATPAACRFFATPHGCRNGDACRFLHTVVATAPITSPVSSVTTSTPQPVEGTTSDARSSSAAKKPCRFFSTQTGCRSGEACPFLHILVARDPSDGTVASARLISQGKILKQAKQQHDRVTSAARSATVAANEAKSPPRRGAPSLQRGQKKKMKEEEAAAACDGVEGSRAQLPRKKERKKGKSGGDAPEPAPPAPATSSANPDATPLALELEALERRFRATGFHVAADRPEPTTADPTIVELSLVPTDPDFPFELESLRVRLILTTAGEPATGGRTGVGVHSRIKVLNTEIPGDLARRVERGWERRVDVLGRSQTSASGAGSGLVGGGGSVLLGLLNWLDRELERLLIASDSDGIGTVTLGGAAASDGQISTAIEGMVAVARAQVGGPSGGPPSFKDRVFYYGVPVAGEGSEGAETERTGSEFNEDDDEDDDDEEEDIDENDEDGEEGQGGSDDGDDSDPAAEGEDYNPTGPTNQASASPSSTPHRGIHVRLPGVKLQNVAMLRLLTPTLHLRCVRCRTEAELPTSLRSQPSANAPPAAPTAQTALPERNPHPCPTCTLPWSVAYRPLAAGVVGSIVNARTVSSASTGVGYLDLERCVPLDVMAASAWELTCEGCGGVGKVLKRLDRGSEVKVGCETCSTKMVVLVDQIRFVTLAPSVHNSNLDAVTSKRKSKKTDDGVVQGEPLPKNGACVHYRKSYRWFRFPCCGRLYACDKCHEEGKPDGHEMAWATRMVCGFCSREQQYSQKACLCGKDLTRNSKGSGFWEGGHGTRSRVLMSRREGRKFKGLSKTVSGAKMKAGG